ncbi:MAG: Ig-like domain-containing protein [Pirellulales bacterium]
MRWIWDTAAAARLTGTGKKNQSRAGRRARLEPLEDRRLLSFGPASDLDSLDEYGIGYSGEAGILTAAPAAPDLLAESDTGVSNTDNLTSLDNSAPDKRLQFAIGNTIGGATVTLYADGTAIGSAVADGATTTVTTNGSFDLADGPRAITARQTVPGEEESSDSAALSVMIDTLAPAFAEPAQLGRYDTSGDAQGVAVSGNLAYVADGSAGLQIIDVANPANLMRLGGYNTSGTASDVVLVGTTAYVADWAAGLQIIDVTNPAAPVRLGGYDTSGQARAVAVLGTVVYLADNTEGLQIIDVTNPAAPVRLGGYHTTGSAMDVAVSGTTAYVADGYSGLAILNVSNPSAPVPLGTFDTTGPAYGVAVAGTVAYVASFDAGLDIIDVTNPAASVRLARYDTSGYFYSVTLAGTLACVADGAGLEIIDVSDAASPVRLGEYDTIGSAHDVTIQGTSCYVADDSAGLTLVDLDRWAAPPTPDLDPASDTGVSHTDNVTGDNTPTFQVTVPSSYLRFYRDGVQISGDYASGSMFTAPPQPDGTFGFAVAAVDTAGNVSVPSQALSVTLDTTIPSAPDLLDSSDSGVSSTDNITMLDNSAPERRLHFAVGNTIAGATVTIYADGVALGSAVADSMTTTVTTNGDYDLADGPHAIIARQILPGETESTDSSPLGVMIDTTAPVKMDPVRLGWYDTTGKAYAVAVSGTLAYVADYNEGLQILDVANPAAPVRLGGYKYNTTGFAMDVVIVGNLAYVADGTAGLQIVDVSNSGSPVLLGRYDTLGAAYSVVISGTLAYVADYNGGLQIIDVTNPAAPVRLGGYSTSSSAWSVAVWGTMAYVAEFDAGIEILDITNSAAPVRVGGYHTSGRAFGVAAAGTMAYVADEHSGLEILDVTDPAMPELVGAYDTGGAARDVTLAGTLAYVADDTGGLQIIDVNNPVAPAWLGQMPPGRYALGVAVAGTTAYVADEEAGVQIVDLSQPSSSWMLDLEAASDTGISSVDNLTGDNTPTFRVSLPNGWYFRFYRDDVQISADYESGMTYSAPVQPDGTWDYGVGTVDAAGNVSAPAKALSVTIDASIPGAPDLLEVSDIGISNADNLTNLDNSRPDKVLQFAVGNTIVGATVTLYADGTAIGSAVAEGVTTTVTTNGAFDLGDGPRAITARQTPPGRLESTDSAVLVVTIDTVALVMSPVRLGGYNTSGSAQGVALSGTVAYVADGSAGLVILDVTNPAAPVRLGGRSAGNALDVAVAGTTAYVAGGASGLVIIDVTNPAAPVLLGTYNTSGSARGVAVSGMLAFVADDVGGLVTIDVTNPAAPVRLGGYATLGPAFDVAVSGTLAYVADVSANTGLEIIDVADPAAPVRLGGYETRRGVSGVAVSGTVAYLTDLERGLAIVDVTNPAAPARLGGQATVGTQQGLTLSGTLVYVAEYTSGLEIFDVSDPAKPVWMGGYDDADGFAFDVAVAGTTVYVADGGVGLEILDERPPAPPSSAPDLQAASDTGISSTDNITSDNTPTLDVPAPLGAPYFRVYRDGVLISGAYETLTTFTAPVQADGTYDVTVAFVDAAGNVSGVSPALRMTIDSAIPSAPDLQAASDTGVSSTDNITNLDNSMAEKTLQFTVGNTIAGAMVTLYADGVPIGNAVADGATTTVTTNGSLDLTDGLHSVTARQTVPGRPESTDSAAIIVTVDTVAPAVSTFWSRGLDTSGSAYGVSVSGTLAYAADYDAGLVIIDVANPAVPVRLGGYDTSGCAYGVVVVGTLAYVADYNGGLVIIDVANPAAPVWVGGYKANGFVREVAIVGSVAYLADTWGLEVIDVANPAGPVRLGAYSVSGGVKSVAVSGTVAYVAVSQAVEILDVTNSAAPVRLGGYVGSGILRDVAVSGTVAYVAGGTAGFVILDVTNPAVPVPLSAPRVISAVDVAVVGTLAYVADGTGLVVLDVSNPASPVPLRGYDTPGSAQGVAVSGTLAYVADGTAGLTIIDLSLPMSPSAPDLQAGSDTGISSSDNITDNRTPIFDMPLLAGSYYRVYRDGVQISGDYQSFNPYSPLAQNDGTYDYTVAAVDAAGNVSPQSPPLAVTIDTKPPTVANVLVGSTRWTGEFVTDLNAANGLNVGGYSIPVGTGAQLSPLAWGNIDQIKIVFNEGVMVDKDDLTLTGVNTPNYDLAGATFSYDPASFTATWTLASAISADKFELRLNADAAGFIQDPIAKRLDGEWTNPASPADTGTDTYPSGNGTAGGDFVFRVRALPCDPNQDGAVDIFDVAKLQVNYGQTAGMMPADGDFDGNGTVDIFDVALLQVAYGNTLDPPAPAPAAAPASGSTCSPLVATRPGHSPADSGKIAASFGGRVSGPPADGLAASLALAQARTTSDRAEPFGRSRAVDDLVFGSVGHVRPSVPLGAKGRRAGSGLLALSVHRHAAVDRLVETRDLARADWDEVIREVARAWG